MTSKGCNMGDSTINENCQINKELLDVLIDRSFKVKENSYSVYSKFRVGCSVLCDDGTIVDGTNVENASLGVGICAERSAFCAAISQGHKKFKAVVISSDMKDQFVTPCGACRQFMSQFALDALIYMTKVDRSYICMKLRDLLPHSFTNIPSE